VVAVLVRADPDEFELDVGTELLAQSRARDLGPADRFRVGALVLQGQAGEALVDSYHHERHAAAVENLRVTSRTARFLAPRSAAEHRLRRAVVALARTHEFARRVANTGRMAQANAYPP